VDRWNPIRTSVIQSRSRPMPFLGFFKHEKGAPRQEISKWSTVCSTFSRISWNAVRSASLVNGRTSKRRPSPRLHEVPIRSNKVGPRTFQMTFFHFNVTHLPIRLITPDLNDPIATCCWQVYCDLFLVNVDHNLIWQKYPLSNRKCMWISFDYVYHESIYHCIC
jgi:hypothetical protein